MTRYAVTLFDKVCARASEVGFTNDTRGNVISRN